MNRIRFAAYLLVVIAASCGPKVPTREEAKQLLQSKLFSSHDHDWEYRRLEDVTGVSTASDSRSAIVEFRYTFPHPGREWEENSYMAKVPLRLYDDGWRIDGPPLDTGRASLP